MSSKSKMLQNAKKINPPNFVTDSLQYEVIMGSYAYGVSGQTSDIDIYGWCIPRQDIVFPHTRGEIPGFSTPGERFEQYQHHHIRHNNNEYDITIYNIVKYFKLCMDCNPNMIDSLFVPRRCITHSTQIGEHVRENRHIFLSKKAWHKFKGYAYSQISKMQKKNVIGKRKQIIEKYGYDIKFAYHVVRLLNEIEQILTRGDLNLEEAKEQLKSIRRGEWTKEQIIEYFNSKEKILEDVYLKSKLPYAPCENEIRLLLLECLEEFYGNLDNMIKISVSSNQIIDDLKHLINKYSN